LAQNMSPSQLTKPEYSYLKNHVASSYGILD
jgi:HD-GYP domain-containing protein (c-di-GMP phosphodiesterase class II)